MEPFFHYTSCHVAGLILNGGFKPGKVGMAGQGVYFTEQSPAEPEQINGASWPSPEFRDNMLKVNYGNAWADPDRALLLDVVLVCFVDKEEVKPVEHRPGAWALPEKHIKNERIIVVRAAIQLYDSTKARDTDGSARPLVSFAL